MRVFDYEITSIVIERSGGRKLANHDLFCACGKRETVKITSIMLVKSFAPRL